MARFRFALEGLLTSRRAAERVQQRVVAEIERERMMLEDRLRAQQASIADGRQDLRSALVGQIDARVLRQHAANSVQQLRLGQRFALELAGVHRRLETAQQALVEAAKSRRAIELLRERRLAEWKAAIDKLETDAMDELAVIMAARNRPEI